MLSECIRPKINTYLNNYVKKHVGLITFVLIEMGYTLTLVYKSHVAFEFIISNVVKMKLYSGLCYVSFEKQFDILTFGKPRECIYFFF